MKLKHTLPLYQQFWYTNSEKLSISGFGTSFASTAASNVSAMSTTNVFNNLIKEYKFELLCLNTKLGEYLENDWELTSLTQL